MCPVGAMRIDRQTDMTTLTVAFRNFENAPPKKWNTVSIWECTWRPKYDLTATLTV